jgi:hypothetical protein
MAYTILIHISNSEPVKLDVEELPAPTDIAIMGRNPRDRADKDVSWLDEGVSTILVPWWRINYIQVLPSQDQEEEFPLPFRND